MGIVHCRACMPRVSVMPMSINRKREADNELVRVKPALSQYKDTASALLDSVVRPRPESLALIESK